MKETLQAELGNKQLNNDKTTQHKQANKNYKTKKTQHDIHQTQKSI